VRVRRAQWYRAGREVEHSLGAAGGVVLRAAAIDAAVDINAPVAGRRESAGGAQRARPGHGAASMRLAWSRGTPGGPGAGGGVAAAAAAAAAARARAVLCCMQLEGLRVEADRKAALRARKEARPRARRRRAALRRSPRARADAGARGAGGSASR